MFMRSRQTGVTFIGWLILLVPIGIVAYAVIRFTPMYLNYMKVAQTLEQTAVEFKGEEQINPAAVRSALQRRFDVQSISYPEVKDISISRDSGQWAFDVNYEDVAKLFGGISLLVRFEKRVAVN
jgi:Domain of unknown function (DUF4845)